MKVRLLGLEGDWDEDLCAPGFSDYLIGIEPGSEGAEMVVAKRRDRVQD